MSFLKQKYIASCLREFQHSRLFFPELVYDFHECQIVSFCPPEVGSLILFIIPSVPCPHQRTGAMLPSCTFCNISEQYHCALLVILVKLCKIVIVFIAHFQHSGEIRGNIYFLDEFFEQIRILSRYCLKVCYRRMSV